MMIASQAITFSRLVSGKRDRGLGVRSMNRLCLRYAALLCLLTVLPGCSAPKTPLEVTQAFWEAVVQDDAEAIAKYSTLTDASQYDRFARDWRNMQPVWGQIVITGDTAKVESTLTHVASPEHDDRRFYTYLINRGDAWQVDFERTADTIRDNPFTQLISALDRIGETISDEWAASSEKLDAEMERLSEQFEQYVDTIGTQASESVQRFSEALRRRLHGLAESVERALKELQQQLSNEDRRTLTEVANDLRASGDALAEPSVVAMADGGRQIGLARQRLQATDDEVLGRYKETWRDWGRVLEADLRRLVEELAGPVERREGAISL